MNRSREPDGLDAFNAEPHQPRHRDTVEELQRTRLAAHRARLANRVREHFGDPKLSDGSEQNQRIDIYAEAVAQVATETGVVFADLFTLTSKNLFAASRRRLTLNGIRTCTTQVIGELAPLFQQALFGGPAADAKSDHAHEP